MPRIKSSNLLKLQKNFQIFGANKFKTDGNVLYCNICNKSITAEKKSQVDQHIKSAAHESYINSSSYGRQTQLLISECIIPLLTKSFYLDLISALVSADISLCKIENPEFKGFLYKYTGQGITSESVLRKSYLRKYYQSKMENIKEKLTGRKLWVSTDETTDSCG